VIDGELGGVERILQILEKLGKDATLDHTLVDDGARGHGRDVNLSVVIVPDEATVSPLHIDAAADQVEGTFPSVAHVVVLLVLI